MVDKKAKEKVFEVPISNVITAFTQHAMSFENVVVIGKFKKGLEQEGKYYVASSCSAVETDKIVAGADAEWLS